MSAAITESGSPSKDTIGPTAEAVAIHKHLKWLDERIAAKAATAEKLEGATHRFRRISLLSQVSALKQARTHLKDNYGNLAEFDVAKHSLEIQNLLKEEGISFEKMVGLGGTEYLYLLPSKSRFIRIGDHTSKNTGLNGAKRILNLHPGRKAIPRKEILARIQKAVQETLPKTN